jgi:hypothetical protein
MHLYIYASVYLCTLIRPSGAAGAGGGGLASFGSGGSGGSGFGSRPGAFGGDRQASKEGGDRQQQMGPRDGGRSNSGPQRDDKPPARREPGAGGAGAADGASWRK